MDKPVIVLSIFSLITIITLVVFLVQSKQQVSELKNRVAAYDSSESSEISEPWKEINTIYLLISTTALFGVIILGGGFRYRQMIISHAKVIKMKDAEIKKLKSQKK